MRCVNKWPFVVLTSSLTLGLEWKKAPWIILRSSVLTQMYSYSSGWNFFKNATQYCPITTANKAWGGEKSGSHTFSVMWRDRLCLLPKWLWMCDAWIQKHSLLKYCWLFFIFSVKKHKHGCQLVTVALRTNELSQLNNKNTQDLHKDWHLGKIKLWNVLRSLFYEFVSPDETECIYSE